MIPGSYCQIVVWLIVTVFAQSFIYADSLFRIADDVIKQTVFDLPKSGFRQIEDGLLYHIIRNSEKRISVNE